MEPQKYLAALANRNMLINWFEIVFGRFIITLIQIVICCIINICDVFKSNFN